MLAGAAVAPRAPAKEAAAVDPADSLYTRIHVELPLQGFQHYVQDADEIVRGIVLEQRSVFPERDVAYTELELAVLSTVKGASLGRIQVRVGGARSDHRVVEVVGAPRFADGEEVLLFLMQYRDLETAETYWAIRGLGHGTYRSRTDGRGGELVQGLHAAGEASLQDFELRVLETFGLVADRQAREEDR